MCQKRNEEPLSFGSDPTITTWYRCQGKAAVMCTEYMELTAHVWVCLHITAFAGAAIPGLPLLQVGYIGGKKGQ